jgi:hypothetical protein
MRTFLCFWSETIGTPVLDIATMFGVVNMCSAAPSGNGRPCNLLSVSSILREEEEEEEEEETVVYLDIMEFEFSSVVDETPVDECVLQQLAEREIV